MSQEEGKEAVARGEVSQEPLPKGRDSIRLRAEELEETLMKAAKKHGVDNLAFQGDQQEQQSKQEDAPSTEAEPGHGLEGQQTPPKAAVIEHEELPQPEEVDEIGVLPGPEKSSTPPKSHLYPAIAEDNNKKAKDMKLKKSSRVEPDEKTPIKEAIVLQEREKKFATFDVESSCSTAGSTTSIKEESGEAREQWDRPVEFLLSCVAMSVGLGNVWRFPYTAYENGGGAFIVPYLVVLLFIGRPLYFLEMAMGQFSSRSSVKVWDMLPAARGVGYGQMFANASVISYYTSLIALALFYIIASCTTGPLPWMVCDDSLTPNNTICINSGSSAQDLYENYSRIFNYNGTSNPMQNADGTNKSVISAAEQYFKSFVLNEQSSVEDGIGNPDWRLALCLLACYVLVFLTLVKGVQSSGKVAYFTALFPYAVLFGLLAKGVTLPGAWNGIIYYIKPQWGELLKIKVWYAAVTQSFFSLSVGFGPIISYSSYNKFNHNAYRDALVISFVDTFTSFLAGFTIFAVLGNLAEELGVPIDEVISSGTGLAFISYPTALGKIGFMPQVFAFLFFLMLITLGMGSVTGLSTGIISIFCDQNPDWNKTRVTAIFCLVGFVVGLIYVTPGGQHILALVDYFGGGFTIFAMTMLEIMAVSWFYGMRRFVRDIQFMLSTKLGIYWKFCWGFFVPVALAAILAYSLYTFEHIDYSGVLLPDYLMYAGWTIAGIAFLQLPYWFLYELFFAKGESCTKRFTELFRPNDDWGPKDPRIRIEWLNAESNRELERVLK